MIRRMFIFTGLAFLLWLGLHVPPCLAESDEEKAEEGSEFGQGMIWLPSKRGTKPKLPPSGEGDVGSVGAVRIGVPSRWNSVSACCAALVRKA